MSTTSKETKSIDEIKYELALAYRIMANEGVVDTFGHVSARHPERPDRYFLSRSRAPELVEPDEVDAVARDEDGAIARHAREVDPAFVELGDDSRSRAARPPGSRVGIPSRPPTCTSTPPALHSQ